MTKDVPAAMRVPSCLAAVVGVPLGFALLGQAAIEHTFDQLPAGATPPGFTFGKMRQPEPGHWIIQRDQDNGVLCHERDGWTGYSLAIADGTSPTDLAVTVRLRLTEGARAGGLVWRYLDDQHYYALVLDLAKGTIAMYRVFGGHHIQLEFEDDLELDPDAWHTLKVVHTGANVRAMLGGVRVFEEEDRRYKWSDEPSRVGVIATGNSRVEFDDLRVVARDGNHR